MRIFLTIISFLLTASIVTAQNIVNGPVPNGLLSLANLKELPSNNTFSKGPHGRKTRCYYNTSYLILSTNVVGEGYKLTWEKPIKPKCIEIKEDKFQFRNELGIVLGLEKEKVLNLLNLKFSKNKKTIIYQSEVIKNDIRFDRQTRLELEFDEDKLSKLSVFNIETR